MNKVLPIDQFPDFFPIGDEHTYSGREDLGRVVYADPGHGDGGYGGCDGGDCDGDGGDSGGGCDQGSGSN